jgi:hypothetical protein
MVHLAPGYWVGYGEMVAMAGDHFESIEQMRELAAKPGPGAGTREELDYVRTVKVANAKLAADHFSSGAKDAADKRYYRLAANNPSHFQAPGKGDAARPVGERAKDVLSLRVPVFPFRVKEVRVPLNAVAAYHMNHAQALLEAAAAGAAGQPIDAALATEAFSNHFLTDAFSAGHIRTERRDAFAYWNEKVPMFRYNLAGYLGQKLAEGLATGWFFSVEDFYSGKMPKNWAGTHKKVDDALNEKGVALTFGHVVVGAIHDYDNLFGIKALVGGREVTLFGDKHLGEGDEERLAVAAVRASRVELQQAYFAGQNGIPAEQIPNAIQGDGPVLADDGLFEAERMLPSALPDEDLGLDATRSVRWECPSYKELLDDGQFQAALNVFGQNKAGELADVVKDESGDVKQALDEKVTSRLRGGQAPDVVREVIEWLPHTGSMLEMVHELDYARETVKTAGGPASLTLSQRIKLVRLLVNAHGDEVGDLADVLLTANRDHIRPVIDAVGQGDIVDKLGVERWEHVRALAGLRTELTPDDY